MKKLAATFDFSDFAKSITYFVILPQPVRRKRSTVLWKIDVQLPVVKKRKEAGQ